MSTIGRKVASARSLLEMRGVRGVLEALSYQAPVQRLLATRRYVSPAFWRHWDNPVLGRLVELRGNRAHIDGCTFTLDTPAIPTGLKALFLFNRYERAERDSLRRHLNPLLPVVELGGSLGVVACITNRLLKNPERHVVVEANAAMLPVLEENRQRNNCRFEIMHRAIGYGSPTVTFFEDDDFLAGSVLSGRVGYEGRPRRAVSVNAVSLREIVDTHAFNQCTLVCDIEGAELGMVEHEIGTLRDRVATIVMETHPGAVGATAVQRMMDALYHAGFEQIDGEAETVVLHNQALSAG